METGRSSSSELCRETVIRTRLAAHGFHFSKRYGQNFLIAASVAERMAGMAEAGRSVLEIGPGFGALTAALCAAGAAVTAIELDKRLLPVLRENVGGYENLTILQGDALRLDLRALAKGWDKPMVCANLPYQITTPVLAKLLTEELFDPLVVMIQREVAERLTAKAGETAYGAFTVFSALYVETEILFPVSPDCFMPRPAVQSSVVCMRRHPEARLPESVRTAALKLSRAAFAQRRKTLANALSAGLHLPREEVAEKLRAAGFDPGLRGETLTPENYVHLAGYFGNGLE